MDIQPLLRVVLDTNVVFEGLTKGNGISGTIIDAWFSGLIHVCVSDALAYEYVDVISRMLSSQRLQGASTTLATLLSSAEFTAINFRWRPSSPDPGDDFVVDCVMNSNAVLITYNIKDFRIPQQTLGMKVMEPRELLHYLVQEEMKWDDLR
ncbi:MAG: putative toxin-antitoxin system toxin component, PIN family [Caldilineaceae bacterium]|nr:putative toxin-antitoxin system toxin component, PIN family [Caldilineaceae bacterium]